VSLQDAKPFHSLGGFMRTCFNVPTLVLTVSAAAALSGCAAGSEVGDGTAPSPEQESVAEASPVSAPLVRPDFAAPVAPASLPGPKAFNFSYTAFNSNPDVILRVNCNGEESASFAATKTMQAMTCNLRGNHGVMPTVKFRVTDKFSGETLWQTEQQIDPATGQLAKGPFSNPWKGPDGLQGKFAVSAGIYETPSVLPDVPRTQFQNRAYIYVSPNHENWMADAIAQRPELQEQAVSQWVLPGSNESPMWETERSDAASFKNLNLTQKNSISEQLALGARYLEFRPVVTKGNDGEIYHYEPRGQAYGQSWNGFAQQVAQFVATHPSEVVVLSLKSATPAASDQAIGSAKVMKLMQLELARISEQEKVETIKLIDARGLDAPMGKLLGSNIRVIVVGDNESESSFSSAIYGEPYAIPSYLSLFDAALQGPDVATKVGVFNVSASYALRPVFRQATASSERGASMLSLAAKPVSDLATAKFVRSFRGKTKGLRVLSGDLYDVALTDAAIQYTQTRE
jgi:hypothetical protein